ncbi:MAG: hypothetical protein IT180_03265 [Acidobacteria bacterium]|nr:hypothetical protein [Acidobacteriota bacterium]
MFGDRYFGPRYFGNRYFGEGGAQVIVAGPYVVTRAGQFQAGAREGECYIAGAVAAMGRLAGGVQGQEIDQ